MKDSFLKNLLVSKINEANRKAQDASDSGDWQSCTKYEIAYFRLIGQFMNRFGNFPI